MGFGLTGFFSHGNRRSVKSCFGYLIAFFWLVRMGRRINSERLMVLARFIDISLDWLVQDLPVIVYAILEFLQLLSDIDGNIQRTGLLRTVVSIRGSTIFIQLLLYYKILCKSKPWVDRVDPSVYVIRFALIAMINLASEVLCVAGTDVPMIVCMVDILLFLVSVMLFLFKDTNTLGNVAYVMGCISVASSFVSRFNTRGGRWSTFSYGRLTMGLILLAIVLSILWCEDLFIYKNWLEVVEENPQVRKEKIDKYKHKFSEIGQKISLWLDTFSTWILGTVGDAEDVVDTLNA